MTVEAARSLRVIETDSQMRVRKCVAGSRWSVAVRTTEAGSTAGRCEEAAWSSRIVAWQAPQLRRCGRISTSCSLVASPSTIADRIVCQRWHSSPVSIPA
jgi:hypothetical protein